jgi:hypothetical protein
MTIKFLSAHTNTKTPMKLSLTAGSVCSALCSTILGTLVARECKIFHNPEIVYHMTFCVVHWN